MANVSHASLTGSNLHEPKGADTAALGTVYVSNGAGGGTWTAIGTSSFTGQVADFLAPVVPAGWLELDGTVISTSTFSALYAVMSITTSGTRTNGSFIITSIPSTTQLKAGYFVFGTGITSGSTIVTVDSPTQITISIAATSSGSSAFAVSPWLLNTGTIQLPDVTTAGRYRRSRTSVTAVGQLQTSQNLAHTHGVSGTTAAEGAHTHAYSGNTGTESATHTHTATVTNGTVAGNAQVAAALGGGFTGTQGGQAVTVVNGTESATHIHAYSGTTVGGTGHSHTFTTTSDSTGSSETRPSTLICLTCVKT